MPKFRILRAALSMLAWPFRAALSAAGALVALVDLRDVFVFGGLASACYGIYQVHEPAAWIAGGTVTLLLGLRR